MTSPTVDGIPVRKWAAEWLQAIADDDGDAMKEYRTACDRVLRADSLNVGIRAEVDLGPALEAVRDAQDEKAAWALLQQRLARRLQPVAAWDGRPEPQPVLWRDTGKDSDRPDPVLARGEVAVLSAAGGTGKSYVALAWALAGATASGPCGAACGLRVRGGPVVLVGYEDSPVRIAHRIRAMHGAPAPESLLLLPNPEPLWEQGDYGDSRKGPHWDGLWRAVRNVRPTFVVVDPASAAMAGATNDGVPVRRFLTQLQAEAEAAECGVLVVCHDNKASRRAAASGDLPGSDAVAGSAAWADAARSVLYLATDPGGEPKRLLWSLKANYGRVGWGAVIGEKHTPGGSFAGFRLIEGGQTDRARHVWRAWIADARKKARAESDAGKDNHATAIV